MSQKGRGFLFVLLLISSSGFITRGISTDSQNDFSNIKISTDTLFPHHVEPSMTIDDEGNIHVGYKNALEHYSGGRGVSYTYSTDGGETWNQPMNMPHYWSTTQGQSDPWIKSYEGKIYFAYLEFQSGQSQITMATTSDFGNEWTLVNTTENQGFTDKETFDIGPDGTIYLAYDDVRSDGVFVRLTRSFDGGNTFTENVTIPDSVSHGYLSPFILTGNNPGDVFVSITALNEPNFGDIIFDKSTDFGETWGVDTDINPTYNASTFTTGYQNSPSVISLSAMEMDSNGRIYLTWPDVKNSGSTDDFDIWMRYSDDNGNSWSDQFRVNNQLSGNQWMPDMAIDSSGKVHFAYYDNSSINGYHLKYRVFSPSTSSFGEEYTVTSEPTPVTFTRPGDYLSIEVDSNDIPHFVWSDARSGEMDIYYGKLLVEETTDDTNTDNGPVSFYVFVALLAIVIIYRKRIRIN